MDYFEKNMEGLKQCRKGLYLKVQEADQYLAINKLDWIQNAVAKDGELYLTIQKEAKEYRLNSSYNPRHEARKWVGQYSFNNMNTVIAMFGIGTGTFAREIMKNRGTGDLFFLYEPCPELFFYVLNHYDITDIINDNRLILTIEGMNEFEFHNQLQNAVNITNIATQMRCIHSYYDKIFPESCIKFWKELKDNLVNARTNINTGIVFGQRFIKNSLFNTKYIKDSICLMDLKEHFQTDVPAIIVAAGPSLQRNIEQLKRAKGKAYLFVVDRILDYVLDEGLEPDFIVTIDPIKPIEYFTKRTDVKIPLLCELVANWEVLDCHKGRKIVFSCNPYFTKMYERLGKTPPKLMTGASVATAAFAACVELGFKRIVLVGQDLAYDGELTHAGGVAEKIDSPGNAMVEGIGNEQVRTRRDWYAFLIWFKDMITICKEVEVIDAKDRGAKIQGATVMSLKEVIDNYCTREIPTYAVMEQNTPTFSESEMIKVKQFFLDCYEELYMIKRKAADAIKICENQISEYQRNQNNGYILNKNFKKLSKINTFIFDQAVYFLLDDFITFASANQISQLYQFSDDINKNQISTYEKSISIFQAIIDATEFVKPLMDEALEEI